MKQQGEPAWYCNRCSETLYFNAVTLHWEHYLQGVACERVDFAVREKPQNLTILGEVLDVQEIAAVGIPTLTR